MNWEQVIIKAILPILFVAIWALTALFNRESKGFPVRPPGPTPSPGPGPRPVDPTMRWSPPGQSMSTSTGPRRVPIGDDDILIIPNDPSRNPSRPSMAPRPAQPVGLRRPVVRGRAAAAPPAKKVEPSAPRTRLSGVNQNVNQQLARPIELTPLTTIAPMATTTGSELASAPSSPSKTSAVVTVSTLIPLMNDPVRLREAFIVNELLQPPLVMRGRRGHRGS